MLGSRRCVARTEAVAYPALRTSGSTATLKRHGLHAGPISAAPSGHSDVTQALSLTFCCCLMNFQSPTIKVLGVTAIDMRGEVELMPAMTGHMFNESEAGTSPSVVGTTSFPSTPARLLKVAYLLKQNQVSVINERTLAKSLNRQLCDDCAQTI